jgi:hypothetical protein
MTRPQGDRTQAGLAVERMCALAGASRASWYRHWAEREPDLEEAGDGTRFSAWRWPTAIMAIAGSPRNCAVKGDV